MSKLAGRDEGDLLEAISFAARAHHGQVRKDGRTPYAAHAFRVCMILRDVFGVAERDVLTAAVLHDTVEDTTTDFDDLEDTFGARVAGWVALLSKDKRRPFEQREEEYSRQLTSGPWQVQVCKLADVYDNLLDVEKLPPEGRPRALQNARRYLDALAGGLHPQARPAWEATARLCDGDG